MGDIIVKLQLRGPLKKYGQGNGIFEYEIAADSCTTSDLLQKLNIPASSVSFIQVDGNKADLDAILEGGEEVVVNPRVAGG